MDRQWINGQKDGQIDGWMDGVMDKICYSNLRES